MGLTQGSCLLGILICVTLLSPALSLSPLMPPNPFFSSKATYYRTPDGYGTPTGACGFGKDGSTINDGLVATVSSRLFNNGPGCGACYQVRCKHPVYCDRNGTFVVATSSANGNSFDFILNQRAFARLGSSPFAAAHLYQYGVVDVEYRRIPCRYPNTNVMYKINEQSRNPDYLALVLLFVGGKNDVTEVQMLENDYRTWRPMRRVYGAVWDTATLPHGNLYIRFKVNGNTKWMKPTKAIPSYWKPGAKYDTGVLLY